MSKKQSQKNYVFIINDQYETNSECYNYEDSQTFFNDLLQIYWFDFSDSVKREQYNKRGI